MKPKPILYLLCLLFPLLCLSQATRKIHSVDIIKMAQQNGKDPETVRFSIDSSGFLRQPGLKKDKVDINTLSVSLNELVAKEQKVVKVDGDNDERTGMHEPHNGLHLFITVIFEDDFDKEKDLKNKTCYRYRETNLPNGQTDFSFFRYLNSADLEIIKKHLQ